jgi:hypothetical protein
MVGRCQPFVRGIPVARLFISYVGRLRAGEQWERKLLAEAEAAEVVLFIASDAPLDLKSFCYRELRAARSTVLAVTIKGVTPDDERLMRALPHEATARQIAALDQQPLDGILGRSLNGRPRRGPFQRIIGRGRLPRSAREITDATARVHRGAWERGGVAGGGPGAAAGIAGYRCAQRSIR